MAPKTGGGGSSSNSGAAGDTSNQCVDSAISFPTNIGRLVTDGLCLVLTLLLVWLWIRARKRIPSIKQLLPWYTFGMLLALTILYLTLGIILTTLGSCFVIGPLSVASVSVPASVASGTANLLLLGIILLPLTRRLLKYGGHQTRTVTIINVVALGLSCIVFVPSIVLSNMASIYKFSSGLDSASRSLVASLSVKLSIAFYTTYFVAAIVGSVILGFALLRIDSAMSLHPRERQMWISLTILSLLVGSGSVVAQMFKYALPARPLPQGAWIAFLAVFNVFFIFTIFAVLESAQTIAVRVVDPKDHATYDPEASQERQPAMHKRFTYTGITEIRIPQNVYKQQNSSWPLHSPSSPRWPFLSPTRATFGKSNDPQSPVQHAF